MFKTVPKCTVFFSNYFQTFLKKGQFLQTEHTADRFHHLSIHNLTEIWVLDKFKMFYSSRASVACFEKQAVGSGRGRLLAGGCEHRKAQGGVCLLRHHLGQVRTISNTSAVLKEASGLSWIC